MVMDAEMIRAFNSRVDELIKVFDERLKHIEFVLHDQTRINNCMEVGMNIIDTQLKGIREDIIDLFKANEPSTEESE